jgi:hypothetical protein
MDELLTGETIQMFTKPIPPFGPLLAQMPSGREIHAIKPYQPPILSLEELDAMRALPPERTDEVGHEASSDEGAPEPSQVGVFSVKPGDYRTGTPNYF